MSDELHRFELAVRRYTAGLIKADELNKARNAVLAALAAPQPPAAMPVPPSLMPMLADYFAAADLSWRETCETATKRGVTSVPIGPAHAAAMDKFNALREAFDAAAAQPVPATGAQPQGWVCPKCHTDRTKEPCPFGHHAALSGACPMTGAAHAAHTGSAAE